MKIRFDVEGYGHFSVNGPFFHIIENRVEEKSDAMLTFSGFVVVEFLIPIAIGIVTPKIIDALKNCYKVKVYNKPIDHRDREEIAKFLEKLNRESESNKQ